MERGIYFLYILNSQKCFSPGRVYSYLNIKIFIFWKIKKFEMIILISMQNYPVLKNTSHTWYLLLMTRVWKSKMMMGMG